MNDDIVTRLREQVDDEFLSYTNVLEAADEIERLRAEVAYLKTPCPRCDYEGEN